MVSTLKIKITAEGETHIEVEGVQGKGCEELSKPFEEALGTLKSRTHKDSYYANTEENVSHGSDQ